MSPRLPARGDANGRRGLTISKEPAGRTKKPVAAFPSSAFSPEPRSSPRKGRARRSERTAEPRKSAREKATPARQCCQREAEAEADERARALARARRGRAAAARCAVLARLADRAGRAWRALLAVDAGGPCLAGLA